MIQHHDGLLHLLKTATSECRVPMEPDVTPIGGDIYAIRRSYVRQLAEICTPYAVSMLSPWPKRSTRSTIVDRSCRCQGEQTGSRGGKFINDWCVKTEGEGKLASLDNVRGWSFEEIQRTSCSCTPSVHVSLIVAPSPVCAPFSRMTSATHASAPSVLSLQFGVHRLVPPEAKNIRDGDSAPKVAHTKQELVLTNLLKIS